MIQRPLLSICIPTYNREPYLKRLLDSIVSQKGFSDQIEIIINDGPSKDNTQLLVNEYQKKYINIKYFRNDKVIGMAPAIIETIDYSTGKYTWIFSSDDVMDKDSLKDILFIINKEDPCLVISNRFVFYKEDEYEYEYNKKQIDLKYDLFSGFKEFSKYLGKDINTTLIEKMDYFTFMSIACFKTEHYKKSLKNITSSQQLSVDELKSHYFNWALIIYSNLLERDKIALVANKEVFAQANNSSWKKNQKIIDDLKGLFRSLGEEYMIKEEGKVFFVKTINYWRFSFSVLHPIIDNRVFLFIKENRFTKKIYKFFAGVVNYIIKTII